MAGNPELCLALTEWQARFTGWTRNPDPVALLNASIFFDFRALAGDAALAQDLRTHLRGLVADNRRFLHLMAANALEARPPLGVLREFAVEDEGAWPRTLDLKGNGTRLFVDAARIFALATGVDATATTMRLRGAGPRLHVPDLETEAAIEAFAFLQLLRLRGQQADRDGAGGANRLDPDTLNEVDRRILKEALRQARRLQTRLALDYGL
jgi:CBS domain-containing protein